MAGNFQIFYIVKVYALFLWAITSFGTVSLASFYFRNAFCEIGSLILVTLTAGL